MLINRFSFNKKMLANRIKVSRKKVGLTQQSLADLIGVSSNTIAKLEAQNHKLMVSYDNLMIICNTLEISPNYLFEIDSNKNNDRLEDFTDLLTEMNPKQKEILFMIMKLVLEEHK